jgi:hypothetical protein
MLSAKSLPIKHDRLAAMTSAEFLAEAWRLANDTARELG